MYSLNIAKAIIEISVNDIRDFIFENCFKRTGISKESSYDLMKRLKRKYLLLLANRLIEKVLNTKGTNANKHYESFLRKKSRKSIKQSEIITNQPDTFNTVAIKSDVTEHPKFRIYYSRLQDKMKR